MSRRTFRLINVHPSGNNIDKVRKEKRKAITRKRNKGKPFGITAIIGDVQISFVIVSLLELFLFRNEVLR